MENAASSEPAAKTYDHRPLVDANGIRYGYNVPPSDVPEVEGAPMQLQTLCGDALRVVLRLNFVDPLNPSKRCSANGTRDLIERIRPAFRSAHLPICLAHDMPAVRIEHSSGGDYLMVEVLVPMGKPLAERVGRLRELVGPLGFAMNG